MRKGTVLKTYTPGTKENINAHKFVLLSYAKKAKLHPF